MDCLAQTAGLHLPGEASQEESTNLEEEYRDGRTTKKKLAATSRESRAHINLLVTLQLRVE